MSSTEGMTDQPDKAVERLDRWRHWLETLNAHGEVYLDYDDLAEVLQAAIQLAAANQRVAEIEREIGEAIDERDAAQESLSEAYKLVMGEWPKWSNKFGYLQALEEMGDNLSTGGHTTASLLLRLEQAEAQLAAQSRALEEARAALKHTNILTVTADWDAQDYSVIAAGETERVIKSALAAQLANLIVASTFPSWSRLSQPKGRVCWTLSVGVTAPEALENFRRAAQASGEGEE